jgi:DNA polymerase V
VYRIDFKYSKAEVMLLNHYQPREFTEDLFARSQSGDATKVMLVLDAINDRWRRSTLRMPSISATPDRAMRSQLVSQSYTTRLDQL